MSVVESSVLLTNRVGLHARPARLLVQTAAQFRARITVQCGERSANARSIIGVLKLEGVPGATLHLRAEGEDAEAAVQTLVELIRRNFDEEEG